MSSRRDLVTNRVFGSSDQNVDHFVLERKSLLTTVLIPLGSVLVAGLGLLVQAVPWWVTAVIVFYILVVALAGVVPVAIRVLQTFKEKMTHRAIVRAYLPQIRRFVTTLSPNLEDSRLETIFYVWRTATSLDQGRNLIKPDQIHQTTLQWWLSSISEELERTRYRDFDKIVGELSRIVYQYNRLCEEARRQLEATLVGVVRDEPTMRHIKHEWNNARDKHNQLIKSWEDIAKNINHEFGKTVCNDHYEFLRVIVS